MERNNMGDHWYNTETGEWVDNDDLSTAWNEYNNSDMYGE